MGLMESYLYQLFYNKCIVALVASQWTFSLLMSTNSQHNRKLLSLKISAWYALCIFQVQLRYSAFIFFLVQ